MKTQSRACILDHFTILEDPRMDRTKKHELIDIIVIAICAVISGAEGWEDIRTYGREKAKWLRKFLRLPNGIPSRDTFRRVFGIIDPEKFQECFLSWIEAVGVTTDGQVIAIDGKTLRRSFDRRNGKSALHLVSAWATTNHLTLGQVATSEKSNEITAIPALLEILDSNGAIITIDAMGCQKEIAAKIRDGGGDYVLAVKDNQPSLHEDIERWFTESMEDESLKVEFDFTESTEESHGRKEIRHYYIAEAGDSISHREQWKDLLTIGAVVSHRMVGEHQSKEYRYYISSMECDAERFANAVRGHWGIENSLHWVLDVTFDEDRCRIRDEKGRENFAMLRRLAVSLLKNEPTSNKSIRGKRLLAAWNHEYLLKVLRFEVK